MQYNNLCRELGEFLVSVVSCAGVLRLGHMLGTTLGWCSINSYTEKAFHPLIQLAIVVLGTFARYTYLSLVSEPRHFLTGWNALNAIAPGIGAAIVLPVTGLIWTLFKAPRTEVAQICSIFFFAHKIGDSIVQVIRSNWV